MVQVWCAKRRRHVLPHTTHSSLDMDGLLPDCTQSAGFWGPRTQVAHWVPLAGLSPNPRSCQLCQRVCTRSHAGSVLLPWNQQMCAPVYCISVYMSMSMCTYVCIRVSACVHMDLCPCVYMCAYMCLHMWVGCVCVYMCDHVCICVHVYVCTYGLMCVCNVCGAFLLFPAQGWVCVTWPTTLGSSDASLSQRSLQ